MQASATSATCHGICCGCSRKTSSARPKTAPDRLCRCPFSWCSNAVPARPECARYRRLCRAAPQASPECRWMVCEIVIHRDAVGFTAQLQTATGVDKRAQRVRGIRRQNAHVTRRGIAIRPLCMLCSPTRPTSPRPLFHRRAALPTRGIRVEFFRLPVALLAHQLLLAPAAHRHSLLQVDVVLRQDNTALPGTMRTRWWNCF